MTDLTLKPFNLNHDEILSIQNIIANMTTEEKIGQLFFVVGMDESQIQIDNFIKKYKPGGVMYRPDSAEKIKNLIKNMQKYSKIPLFCAANLEYGGNGIITEGSWLGTPLQIAATDDPNLAFQLGKISGEEACQVGCNMSFAPVVDIDFNFRNPITNIRTFGSDVKRVLSMSREQIRGLETSHIIPTIKHFPGDGVDERDQHLLSSVNSLSSDEWTASYGKIYKSLIEDGVPCILVGHIYQPDWERKLDPSISESDLKPASASKMLVNGLLREELSFKGLALTDATTMVGYNVIMPRKDLLVETINAGIDMILFNKNIDEDYEIITNAVKQGVISQERLDEAVTRILGIKMARKLMDTTGELIDEIPTSLNVNLSDSLSVTNEIAKKSITLVKDREQLIPISPEKTPRIRLVVLGGSDDGGIKTSKKITTLFKEGLHRLGFEVIEYQMDFHETFLEGVSDLNQKFDLAIYVANIETASNQTTTRINWIKQMAANAPWFAKSIPTLFISTANPHHLFDVPYISTYINAYAGNKESIEAVLRKISGKEEFTGINPTDPFCNDFVAKL